MEPFFMFRGIALLQINFRHNLESLATLNFFFLSVLPLKKKLHPFLYPLTLTSFHIHAKEKHPHTMMLLPLGVLRFIYSAVIFCTILASSDNSTLVYAFAGQQLGVWKTTSYRTGTVLMYCIG